MRAFWEALHTSLVRSVRTQQLALAFQQAKRKKPALAKFDDPTQLVAYLTSKVGDLDDKDRILRVLVTLVQQHEHHELAFALLWLGLWPGLDVLYRSRLRHFKGESDELVAELSQAFTTQVQRLDLAVVTRIAATLVRSTERDVMDRRRRHLGKVHHSSKGKPNDLLFDLDDNAIGASGFDKVSFQRWATSDREMPRLSFEQDIDALRAWLVPVVGEDTDLLLSVLVWGETQREVGKRMGLASDAVHKRFQRALGRLRKHLGKSLSRFGLEIRVSKRRIAKTSRRNPPE
jgi:RNA polymerase sigma-70 factor (ECF subfamily)